jgi:hypothetical protein
MLDAKQPDALDSMAQPPLDETLGSLLLGVLACASPSDGYAALITAARQHSSRLGHQYAQRGQSAVALARAYRRVHGHACRLAPPLPTPRTADQLGWELRLYRAVEDFHLIALCAFERERRVTGVAARQAAQDQAVEHMAAALRETLVQTLTLCTGYTELLASRQLPDGERQELLHEWGAAQERLIGELRRWLAARRYVTQRHGAGFLQLDIDQAAAPPPE